jgi:hypothetical protein
MPEPPSAPRRRARLFAGCDIACDQTRARRRLILKVLINLFVLSGQGVCLELHMRTAEFAVKSYLALVAVGYVVLCSALLNLALH